MEKSIEKALNDLGSAVKEHLDREGQILSAMDAFSVLLRQQLERIDNMQTDKVDFSQKETVTIGVINGDGIGEIIVPQAKRVLEALRRASAGRTVLSVSHRIYENLGGRTVEIKTQVQ